MGFNHLWWSLQEAESKVRKCSNKGCTKQAKHLGVCIMHGAKMKKMKQCSHQGCTKQAQREGVCVVMHGMKVKGNVTTRGVPSCGKKLNCYVGGHDCPLFNELY
jgi:hypothetical protein